MKVIQYNGSRQFLLKSKYREYEISMIFSWFNFGKKITADEHIFTGNFN